jgi:HK97 family phage portal protein
MSKLLAALGHRPSLIPRIQKSSRIWPDVVAPYGSSAIPTSTDYASLAKAYCEVIYVHVSISKMARALAFRPLKFFDARGDKEIENHWMIDLFGTANPYECGYMIMQQIVSYLMLTGNAYLSYDAFPGVAKTKDGQPSPLLRAGINPKEIYVLRPDRVKIVADPVRYIGYYEYTAPDGVLLYYRPEEIVHFRTFNPSNDFYGLSRVAVGKSAIDGEKYAVDYNKKFFENSARPDGYLKTEQDIDESAANQIRNSWENNFRGWWNAHRTAVLTKGADYKLIQATAKDMDFMNLRDTGKRDITNLLDMPLTLVEMVNATFDNVSEGRKEFWSNVQIIGKEITGQLSESFLFTRENLWCEFDYSDVKPLQEDEDRLSQIGQRLASSALFSVNEIRERLYKAPPVAWGDRPWIPIGLIQAGDQPPMPEPLEEPIPPPKSLISKAIDDTYNDLHWFMCCKAWDQFEIKWIETLKRLFREQEREVLGKLGQKSIRVKELDQETIFAMDRWVTAFYQSGQPLEALVFGDGIEQAKRYLHDSLGLDVALTIDSHAVQEYLMAKTMKFAKDVNATTAEAIRKQVDAGIFEGETIDQISGRVREVFGTASKSRAQLIARTETIGASNQGTLMTYKAAGIRLKKKWYTAQDEKVRDSHRRAGALPAIDLNLPFIFAGEGGGEVRMNAPGDPSGGPAEICNCRCGLLPIQEGI